MITLLLFAILVVLIIDVREHRDCRDETWLVLQRICLAEWDTDRLVDQAIEEMLHEARRAYSASWSDDAA